MFRILLCMVLALCLLPAAGTAEGETIYTSDFSKGADGWYGRGAQSTVTKEGTLRTTGRSSDWNSPGRDFPLVEGGLYEFAVEVKQDDLDSAAFMVSIAHTVLGSETYENLAFGSAPRGEWITLKGSYTAGDYDRSVLYVETTGAPSLEYEIRNFILTAPEGVPEAKATEPPMEIQAAENIPSLKEIYAGKFDFGVAVPGHAFGQAKLKEMILQQYSILTPENEMKPDAVLDVAASKKLAEESGDDTSAAVHLDAAKPLLNFAKENGLKVHGHTLLWGKNPPESQTPKAFFHEGYDTSRPLLSRETMLGRLENYIKAVFEATEAEWPGVIVSWDVLNEAINDDGDNWLRNCVWTQVIGEDYPNRAFEYARKYAPEGTKLYYNDYSTASPAKRKGIIRLLNQLAEDGNIDGYGFQMHHGTAEPTMEAIRASVEDIAELGLCLRVSELDVGTSRNTETAFTKQAEKYGEIMQLLLEYSDRFEAVQVWGLTDAMSWRGREFPLLFDSKGNPKPAFWAVAEANDNE